MRDSVSAKFTAKVVLPTPPLPEETVIIRRISQSVAYRRSAAAVHREPIGIENANQQTTTPDRQ